MNHCNTLGTPTVSESGTFRGEPYNNIIMNNAARKINVHIEYTYVDMVFTYNTKYVFVK